MPNKYQAAFLASLLLTFSALVLLSHFINSKLIAAGYDFSKLILIGLPEHPSDTGRFTMADFKAELQKLQSQLVDAVKNVNIDDFKAVEVPYLGTYNLVEIASSPAVVFTAAIIVATAFYSKVLHTGSFCRPNLRFPYSPTLQAVPSL